MPQAIDITEIIGLTIPMAIIIIDLGTIQIVGIITTIIRVIEIIGVIIIKETKARELILIIEEMGEGIQEGADS